MERRRSPRLPVQVEVEARCEGEVSAGITVNLSLTGACALMEGDPKEFSQIELSLKLPIQVEDDEEVFEVNFPGVIVRAEPTDSRTIVAVMFQRLPVESEWALSKFLLNQFDDA